MLLSEHKKLSVLKGSKIIMVFSFLHSVGKNSLYFLSKYPTWIILSHCEATQQKSRCDKIAITTNITFYLRIGKTNTEKRLR